MVRAILEGRKTVTRRVCKPQPSANAHTTCASGNPMGAWWETGKDINRCPHSKPGDRLWVRESLGYDCEYGNYFAAGGKHGETVYLCSLFDDEHAQAGPSYDGLLPERSVPSIHLHRRYSRILLEITDVRVERLQDISEEQALAEGIVGVAFRPDDGFPICTGYMVGPDDGKSVLETTAAKAFAKLWQSTGGDWEANPWVWVVEFRRVQP
ncbi:hypothetical protein ACKWMZ_26645 [Pseudomonas protegens]|uniref:hypothetical protein n=1 Tax=Pseudomonas protegens TaxID=380021 RepID=UPI003966E903